MNYYNENDPKAAAWLRELIKAGHIAEGDVDERSIEDVIPTELSGYTQCHFFAGIGIWSYALRQAGWPDDRPVWTGSCPCQPFSAAGKGKGIADERHLWPAWHHLINQCKPPVVFGEQVASKDGLAWWDIVQTDLEGAGYSAAAFDLCAAGVGAPHIRQRLFFVADTDNEGSQRYRRPVGFYDPQRRDDQGRHSSKSGMDDGMADSSGECVRRKFDERNGTPFSAEEETWERERRGFDSRGLSADDGLADANNTEWRPEYVNREDGCNRANIGREETHGKSGTFSEVQRVGHAASCGRELGQGITGLSSGKTSQDAISVRSAPSGDSRPSPTNGFWRDADWLFCTDGKWRPVEPGTFPLVDGSPARVGRLRGYGNAIVAPVAQAFIESFLLVEKDIWK